MANATAGDAAPLRTLPLLNPLEIGQGVALLAIALWWQALPRALRERAPRPALFALGGATAFGSSPAWCCAPATISPACRGRPTPSSRRCSRRPRCR